MYYVGSHLRATHAGSAFLTTAINTFPSTTLLVMRMILENFSPRPMMAYIDWDNVEAGRVEAEVKWQIKNNPDEATRRGMGAIWRRVEEHEQAQTNISIK